MLEKLTTPFNLDEKLTETEHPAVVSDMPFTNLFDPGSSETKTDTREVSILLSDLRGFTALSEHYPATDVMNILNRYYSIMSEIIVNEFHGTIDKFMGDSIMALFGAPHSRHDDTLRALSCAVKMQIAMDEFNQQNLNLGLPQLFMGIGINTGLVVAGQVGSILHQEYTVIGDEVNVASRIEAYTLRGQILISENTYNQSRQFIQTSEAHQVYVKGKKEAINLYELLAINAVPDLIVPRREIRKSRRINVCIPFTYQHIQHKSIENHQHQGEILDISYNGMCVRVSEPLGVFSEIKLSISLSLMAGRSSDIYAKVLRCVKEHNHYKVNIEFSSLSHQANKAIRRFVDELIQSH